MEYAKPNILISTDEVAARLGSADLHLIEVDEDTAAYERGHLQGALPLNWRDELQRHDSRDVVAQEGFEALMAARGIDENTEVVLYGGNNNWFAAYGYWYFKLYGHDHVRLMNGGRKRWELEQRPLATDVPSPTPTTYTAKPINQTIRALRDEVIAVVGTTPMIDALTRGVQRCPRRPCPPAAGAGATERAHPWRGQHSVVARRQRGRHLSLGGRVACALPGLRQAERR